MRHTTPDFLKVLDIFNAKSKQDLEKRCRNLVLNQTDFAALILADQHGVLEAYQYANYFAPPYATSSCSREGRRICF
jgi:hypothetical protein